MNEKISMAKKSNLSVKDAHDLFIRKCKVKNLAEKTLLDYDQKLNHFYGFFDENSPVRSITKDTIDDYIIWLRENTAANDITINSYLHSLRAFSRIVCRAIYYFEKFLRKMCQGILTKSG